jgi:hypothetical protein
MELRVALPRRDLSLLRVNAATRGRLHLYLGDHIAAAAGGVELCRRAARAERRTELGPPLRDLAREIEQDLGRLREIAKSLGAPMRAPLKEGMARLAEKLGRFKLNKSLLTRSPLSRVYELELLQAAVSGKRGLWHTLLELEPSSSPLDRDSLEQLIARADAQEARLRDLHHRAAWMAFGEPVEEMVSTPA